MSLPLIVIVGETASGKSKAAQLIAKKFNGEIISADSWTVYKEFDIGTAKPSIKDRQEVAHHLLDVADPKVGFSAAIFKILAVNSINDILTRNKLPILVGGTGLYIDSVIYDYDFLPPGYIGQRQELEKHTIDELIDIISYLNYSTEAIDLRNKRRLIRLIEAGGLRPVKKNIRPNTYILGIKLAREELEKRIENRVKTMIKKGLVQEVTFLANKYGWDIEPMKGIGYREFKPYLNGSQKLNQVSEQIMHSSLLLAKKQRTWFKRNKYIQWFSDPNKLVEEVTTLLNK